MCSRVHHARLVSLGMTAVGICFVVGAAIGQRLGHSWIYPH